MANNFELNFIADSTDFVLDAVNPPTAGTVQDRPYLAFNDTTNQLIRTKGFFCPSGFTSTGLLLVDLAYAIDAPSPSGNIVWLVEVEAIPEGQNFNLFTGESWDPQGANSFTDPVPTLTGRLGVASVELIQEDNMAPDSYVRLKIERNAASGSDTSTGDARLFLARMREQQ